MSSLGRTAGIVAALLFASGVVLGHPVEDVEIPDEGPGADGDEIPCEAGLSLIFACRNADLLAWLPPSELGLGTGNDIWGWTDPVTGHEIAIVGFASGTAFVDVTEPTHPVHLGTLPPHGSASIWRDIKVYDDHVFVVSEAANHGMQIMDLRRLRDVAAPPETFAETAHYAGFGRAHNLAIDEETGYAYAVGSNTCAGGLHSVSVRDPRNPVAAGCFAADGYTHDAQCVVYHGPDADHRGREICFNSNEDTVTIVDVTNKAAPRMLSRTGYAGRGYTHQGWLTEDHRFFLLGDEFDERFYRHGSRTHIWDVSDLDAPFVVGAYTSESPAVDHNLFVVGKHVYEANYRSGLRVLRFGRLEREEMVEVAFFDTYPNSDSPTFSGAWGVYPFFASGTVVVSDINRGLFVIHPHPEAVPECGDGIDNDGDGLVDHPEDPSCAGPDGAREAPRSDVAIDIRPGTATNTIQPRSEGFVPVAILGSETFDVGDVEPTTLAFGPAGAPLANLVGQRFRDVDGDGRGDLVGLYRIRDSGVAAGDTEACLGWETRDGTAYAGCDAVVTPPPAGCGNGFEAALALPLLGWLGGRRGRFRVAAG